jgi:hypothetical protein
MSNDKESYMDLSGNPPPTRPPTPLPKLLEGVKTIDDIFKRMGNNTTLESFVDAGRAATGVVIETKPLEEKDMDLPTPATREDNNMTLKQQFASLAKFKDVPMTYSEMRERYG